VTFPQGQHGDAGPGKGGEVDDELASLVVAGAARRDAAPVALDDSSYQRQPEPEATARTPPRRLHLHERLQGVREHLPGAADAAARPPDDGVGPGALDRDRDVPPGWSVLDGIVEEIGDDLLEPRRISLHDDGLVGDGEDDLAPARGCSFVRLDASSGE